MDPIELANGLKEALQENLISVTLYGPEAVKKEDDQGNEDFREYPLLIVTRELNFSTFHAMHPLLKAWHDSGNPMPMIFTEERLNHSSDSFPVEFLDMKEARKVLHGPDSILTLEVGRAHFQQELIHNLKSELLRLRSRFLENMGKPEALKSEICSSLATIHLLMRATLRLYVPVGPSTHKGVMNSLKIHIPINPEVFESVQGLRIGKVAALEMNMDNLYFDLLRELEKIIDGIDRLKIRRAASATYPPFQA